MVDVPNQNTMRALGCVTLITSIIQIGVSAGAYAMTSWKAGAWWAGALCFITSLCAIISANKCSVISGCLFSVISIILLVVGLIIDGIVFGATNGLDTCVDQDTNKFYGDSKYNIYATACRIDHSQTCVCVNSDNTDNCYLFNLQAADNCGQILTKLPSLLLASVLFMLVLIVLVFAYSIFTCKTVCCASPEDAARLNGTAQASSGNVPTVPATVIAQPVTNKV